MEFSIDRSRSWERYDSIKWSAVWRGVVVLRRVVMERPSSKKYFSMELSDRIEIIGSKEIMAVLRRRAVWR